KWGCWNRYGVCRWWHRRRRAWRVSAACCRIGAWRKGRMLRRQIEELFDHPPEQYTEEHFAVFQEFKRGLNRGGIRAAEPDATAPGGWRAESWVKKGILLGFRMGTIVDMSIDARKQPFFD